MPPQSISLACSKPWLACDSKLGDSVGSHIAPIDRHRQFLFLAQTWKSAFAYMALVLLFLRTHLSKCSSFSGALTQTSKTLAHFLKTAGFQFPGFQPTWKTGALSREIGLVVPISQSESLCLAWFLASRGLRLVALVMMMTAKPGILFSQILQWYCWLFSWDAKSAPVLKVQNFQKFWGYRRCISVQLCFLTSEENKNILCYLPDTKFLKNKL